MKKSLSVLVAGAMVSSMFASIAFAADAPLTTQQKLDALIAAGIFDKDGTGNGSELDANMSREQLAKILAKLKGLKEVSGTSYSDVAADRWSAGFIQAVTKAAPPLMDGVWDGVFAPAGDVTLEQLAAVAVRALGLKVDTSATVTGKVSDWAKGYVAAAITAGILPKDKTDFTAKAIRTDLVEATYSASLVLPNPNQAAVSAKIVGASKIEVTFSAPVDDTKATFSVKKGAVTVTTTAKFDADKKVATIETASKLTKGDYTLSVGGVVDPAYTQSFSVEDEKVAKVEFTSDKASYVRNNDGTINTKKVTTGVKLTNQYGEDVTKTQSTSATVSVGIVTANPPSIANGVVTVESSTELTLNQVINVSVLHNGGAFASQALTVSPTATAASFENLKLYNAANKELVADSVAGDFYVLLDAKDQYGNAISASSTSSMEKDTMVSVAGDLYASVTKDTYGDGAFQTVTLADGTQKLALQLAYPGSSTKFTAGTAKITIYSLSSGKSASYDVTVKDIVKVDSLTLSSPDIAVANEKVYIPFIATDATGAEVTSADVLNDKSDKKTMMAKLSVGSNTIGGGISSDRLVFEQDPVTNKPKLALDLTGLTVDNAAQLFISGITGTGKQATINVTINPNVRAEKVAGITGVLTTLAPTATTVLNSAKLKVVDQYGRTLTGDKFAGRYDFVLTTTGTSLGVPSGNLVNADKTVTANETTGTTTVKFEARNISTGQAVVGSDYTTSFRTVSRNDIVDFKVADVAKIYTSVFAVNGTAGLANSADNSPKYKKGVAVTGLLADGTEVAINANDRSLFQVVAPAPLGLSTLTSDAKFADGTVMYATGTVTNNVYAPDTIVGMTDNSEKTYTISIIGKAKDGAIKPFTKDIVVSNVAPVATTLALRSATKPALNTTSNVYPTPAGYSLHNVPATVIKETDGIISIKASELEAGAYGTATTKVAVTKEDIANSAVSVTDQYGVELLVNPGQNKSNAAKFASVDVYGLPTGKTLVSQLAVNETATIVVTTTNGKVLSFKLIVKP